MTIIEDRKVDKNFVIMTGAFNRLNGPLATLIKSTTLFHWRLKEWIYETAYDVYKVFVDCEESREFGSHGGRCASVNGCLVGSKQRARHLRVLFGHMRDPLCCTLASAPDFNVNIWLAMVFGQFLNGSGIFALTLACFCFFLQVANG